MENLPVPFDRRVWMESTTLRDAGYGVTVICPTGVNASPEEEVIDGVRILRHPLPAERSSFAGYVREYSSALVAQFRLARRVMREGRVDIVHICNPPDLLFLVALYVKVSCGARIIFDHHDLSPELFEAKFGRRGLLYWVLRLLEYLTYQTADHVIATNESFRTIALRRGHVHPRRVSVVRSAPAPGKFAPRPADGRPWHAGRPFLLAYIGVMGESDGVDGLLDVAHILRHRGRRDVRMVLIGTGPMYEKLRTQATQMRLEDNVEFLGAVHDETVIKVLSEADVCLNPDPCTVMNDLSTMNKILEYMALAKPIVQYDLWEGRVSAGEACLYARCGDPEDFADCIERLLDRPKERARRGALGRERFLTSLSWEHQRNHLLDAYAAALDAERTRGPLDPNAESP
ncbi:MAG TPA: glycosyltransferase family 4 protein [Gemmatimonadales bacterium]